MMLCSIMVGSVTVCSIMAGPAILEPILRSTSFAILFSRPLSNIPPPMAAAAPPSAPIAIWPLRCKNPPRCCSGAAAEDGVGCGCGCGCDCGCGCGCDCDCGCDCGCDCDCGCGCGCGWL